MKVGPRSIRAKLVALVLLPVLLMLGLLGVMERVLEGQVLGEAERRAQSARRSLQIELDDDLTHLKVALLQLSGSQRLRRALAEGNRPLIQRLAERFSGEYPDIAILVADARGEILVQTGVEGVARLEEIAGLAVPSEPGAIAKTLMPDGCAGSKAHDAPARVLATRAGDSGVVVACQKLDGILLRKAADKLGVVLALIDDEGRLLASTEGFPAGAPRPARDRSLLHDDGTEVWALARFCPGLLPGAGGDCAMESVSALAVTELRDLVRKDFLLVMLAVLGAGLVALLVGGRLALRMTRAIDRIVAACRRLAKREYKQIDLLPTGDEIEELGERFNEMVEGLEERDRLRTTFGKYMTESVVSHLLENRVRLGGDMLPVTILFTDIRGFTAMSERLDAQSVVALLNEYFTEMVDIVMDHGGVVDKYIGDAIMVVFGAPVPHEDDALRAVRAAIQMRAALAHLNERLVARGHAPIRTGIGIHSGDVVAGNIGSERRMEYTVIGDAVNLASRLEGCTKDLGADVVISEATYEQVRGEIEARFLQAITVKGREQPVNIYAVAIPGSGEAALSTAAGG